MAGRLRTRHGGGRFDGELLSHTAGLARWISRSRVQVLVGKTHAQQNPGSVTALVLISKAVK